MQFAVAWVGGPSGRSGPTTTGNDDTMKTTVKLDALRAIIIEPTLNGGVLHSLRVGGCIMGSFVLTPDQLGAVQFGQEQAAEAAGIAVQRAGA